MAAIQELVGSIRLDASEVKKGVSEAQSGIQGLGDKAASVGSSMQSAGKKMTMGVTTPLVAMGATAVSQAATFESAMQQSIAIMGDVSEAERRDLEQTAREVAKSTTMSHEQSAESYYYLASAGMDAAQSMEAMPVVAEYAEAAQLDMATATDFATDIMSAFGYEASELTTVTDTLTQTVSNHNTTAEQMGTAMSYVAPVANSLGISIQETSSALGMFSDVGIKGSKAGTALRGVLASLADPTAKQADLLQELGVKTTDAQGNMLPLVDIVRQLENAGADTADVMALFGREAGPAMAALLAEGSDALEENTQALMDAEGATKSVAETQRDTLMGSLQILKSNLTDVAITFGTEFIPFIRMAADAASALATGFGTIPGPMRKVIIVAAALVAAIGPILLVVGTLLTMVPSLIAGWGALTGALAGAGVAAGTLGTVLAALTGPIGILIGAVALLGAAWATNFGGIRDHVGRLVAVINDEFGPSITWLKNIAVQAFGLISTAGGSLFSVLEPIFGGLVQIIVNGLIVAIRTFATVARAVFQGVSVAATAFRENTTFSMQDVRTAVALLRQGIEIAGQAINAALARVQAFWSVWGSSITNITQMAGRTVLAVIRGLADFLTTTLLVALQIMTGDWQGAWNTMQAYARRTAASIRGIVAGWTAAIRGLLGQLETAAGVSMSSMMTRISTTISSGVTRIRATISGWVDAVIGLFQRLYQRLVGGSIVPNMVNAIVRAFANLASRVTAAITNLKNQTIRAFATLKNRVVSAADTLRSQTVGKILALKSRGVREFNALKAQAIRAFNNLKNRVVSAANRLRAQGIQKFNNLKNRAVSIVRSMMRSLPRIIRRASGAFKRSGASLISAFARGISGKIGRVRSSVKNAVAAARRYLPSSDADEGPLSDLTRAGAALVETFAAGIEGQRSRVERAVRSIVEAARDILNTEVSMAIGVHGAGGAPAAPQYANFDALADAAVERRGEYDGAAVSDVLSEYGEGNLFRLAEEMSKAAEIMTSEGFRERGTFRMKNPFTNVRDTFRQLKEAAADPSKMSQALYDSFTYGGQFGFEDEMEDIFNRAIEARRKGMIQAEDGTWVDPSFYSGRPQQGRAQASGYSVGGGAGAHDRATGEQIAQAIRDVLAGSKLEVDVEDEELVDRATLRIKDQRRQNVRSSVRSP